MANFNGCPKYRPLYSAWYDSCIVLGHSSCAITDVVYYLSSDDINTIAIMLRDFTCSHIVVESSVSFYWAGNSLSSWPSPRPSFTTPFHIPPQWGCAWMVRLVSWCCGKICWILILVQLTVMLKLFLGRGNLCYPFISWWLYLCSSFYPKSFESIATDHHLIRNRKCPENWCSHFVFPFHPDCLSQILTVILESKTFHLARMLIEDTYRGT